jgi:Mannose-1-phosphate guanylyltransferase
VTIIGIPPTRPHMGYGYIKTKTVPESELAIVQVDSFKEKPDLPTALQYVESGDYYWNAGIFVLKAQTLVQALQDFMPDHYSIIKSYTDKGLRLPTDIAAYYEKLDPVSIDYGIMEKLQGKLALVEATFNWDDIGSWAALESYLNKDETGNAFKAKAVFHESSGNIVVADNPDKVVAVAGVNDLVVVDTADALLVLPKAQDQAVKQIYDKLEDTYT